MFDVLKQDATFRYRLLSRMKQDCEYFLGYGNRSPRHLWAGEVAGQIETMKALHNSFPEGEKPEWLTWEDILKYEADMTK